MRMHRICAYSLAFFTATSASAAIVTYNVDLSEPGKFKVFASASAGDNFGLACYGLPFTAATAAMITSIEQMSPEAYMVTDASGRTGPAGFTVLRTQYASPTGGLTLCASQDVIGETPHLIRGFGQTAGSFSELALTSLRSSNPSWGESLLIVQGTYAGDASEFRVDTGSVDLVANVFSASAGGDNIIADVHVFDTSGFSYIPPPPPPPIVIEPPPVVVEPPPVVVEPPTVIEPPIVEPEPPAVSDPPTEPILPETPEPPSDEELGGLVIDPGFVYPTIPTLLPVYPDYGVIDFVDYPWDGTFRILPSGLIDYDLTDIVYTHASVDEFVLNRDHYGSTTPWFHDGGLRTTSAGIATLLSAFQGQNLNAADIGVPEPTTTLLAGLALATLFADFRRRPTGH